MAIKSSGWRLIPKFSGASCLIYGIGKTTPLDEEILGAQSNSNPEKGGGILGAYGTEAGHSGGWRFWVYPADGAGTILEPLSGEERRMFSAWLNQINEHEISDVMALFPDTGKLRAEKNGGGCWVRKRLAADLAHMKFYLGGRLVFRMEKLKPRG